MHASTLQGPISQGEAMHGNQPYKVVENWLTNYFSKLVLGGLVSLA